MSPVSILKVVVLPAPLTPSRPKHWPAGTPTQRWSTAAIRPFFPGDQYTWKSKQPSDCCCCLLRLSWQPPTCSDKSHDSCLCSLAETESHPLVWTSLTISSCCGLAETESYPLVWTSFTISCCCHLAETTHLFRQVPWFMPLWLSWNRKPPTCLDKSHNIMLLPLSWKPPTCLDKCHDSCLYGLAETESYPLVWTSLMIHASMA